MAFDGVTIANIVSELKKELLEGRVYKIAQPEADELLLTIKTRDGQRRLVISASASLPLIYLTESNKPSPMTAPNFCMLLRKHLQNGRITSITQPGLERIIHIDIEHLDEMGDLCRKTLIVEIMGKHSNIIFCDNENRIIDSIKHVSAAVSSVREVLPGKTYFVAQTQEKLNLLTTDYQTYYQTVSGKAQPLFKALYGSFTGLSPILAQELCYRAGLDGEASTAAYAESAYHTLYLELEKLTTTIREETFTPCIAYRGKQPVEYAAVPLTMYDGNEGDHLVPCGSMSTLLETYYAEKNTLTRIRQKSADLRHVVQTALERNVKKYDLQLRQMQDTKKRETYRIYGELLNTYGYSAKPGDKSIEVLNYYTNEPLTIPLDETLSATDNAKRYFEKYNKMKRTYEALSELTQEVKSEIDHLESIGAALDIALKEEDLVEIREELAENGYIKRSGGKGSRNPGNKGDKTGKIKITSKPFHYLSSDGFHIYVGKNNFQNDELTFQFANGNDWWFHAKKMPGSHVVVKTDGTTELPDRVFEEAAKLAAYYSKGRGSDKVEIDYIQKKHVKKPGGAKPGFVVYYTNFSMVTDSDITGLKLLEQ
ncbi:MAG: NFACT family protein [Lachnospiraceae bacterium]|nr:NFACT family protein [Lachnospiraceae bacterium]